MKYPKISHEEYEAFVKNGNVPGLYHTTFADQINKMNSMYSLPINKQATLDVGEPASIRITNFLKTLQKEIDEGVAIQERLVAYEAQVAAYTEIGPDQRAEILEPMTDEYRAILTDLADWFNDIIVYCASEATKFGIPYMQVLWIIMASNFTKLGADGEPIKNEHGKVEKGPNFQPPEKFIQHLLFSIGSAK